MARGREREKEFFLLFSKEENDDEFLISFSRCSLSLSLFSLLFLLSLHPILSLSFSPLLTNRQNSANRAWLSA